MKGYKTYLGIAVLAIPAILKNFFDIEVSSQEVQLIVEQAATVLGSILAIYGRYDANK